MAHLTADAMTAGPAPAIHAGINVQICRFAMGGTSSGSLTVHLTPLPAGAQVVGCTSLQSNAAISDGTALINVYSTIGGTKVQTYIGSAASALAVSANNSTGIGRRLTASAVAWFQLTNMVNTGTATCDFTVVLQYLTQLRGD